MQTMELEQAVGIDSCKLLSFPVRSDVRGSLTYVEHPTNLPFAVKRVFYIYNIPENQTRGAHAHKVSHQLIICLAGSIRVTLDDGTCQRSHKMENPHEGLWVPPGIWVGLSDFAPGAVGLVLASDLYDESDYMRDYDDFLRWGRGRSR